MAEAPSTGWISLGKGESKSPGRRHRYFRKTFQLTEGVQFAKLQAAADAQFTVFLNGKQVNSTKADLKHPIKSDVTADLLIGENVIAADVQESEDRGALVILLNILKKGHARQMVRTDETWLSSHNPNPNWNSIGADTRGWTKSLFVSKYGYAPYGDVFNLQQSMATKPDQITVAAGFRVQLLAEALPTEGSWVSLTVDHKGRLYISPERKYSNWTKQAKLLRITLGSDGRVAKREDIDLPVTSSMGMLWAFNSLYVNGGGPSGFGIYRLSDTNGDDVLDTVTLLKKFSEGAEEEHGAHGIVLGPDQQLYIAIGNRVQVVNGISRNSHYRNWKEGYLSPQMRDPSATAANMKMPHGYILRTDATGNHWDLFAAGFRNQYRIDFNAEGELFTFDSDTESDVGLPWYRPTRILHVTSGSDFGFREGNAKFPEYYPDTMGAVVNVGRGSPTGVKFGTQSNFPERYKQALFVMDWTYGRILAVHMREQGASYYAQTALASRYDSDEATAGGDVEVFLSGKGMPVTDLEFGKDGAMYFTVGGRGTMSALYRVSWPGNSEGATEGEHSVAAASARLDRRMLEAFHGHADPKAVDIAWPFLSKNDSVLRYAARLAIEAQPPDQWRERALAETNPIGALTTLIALARVDGKPSQERFLRALMRFPLASLDEPGKIAWLRAMELSFINQGTPTDAIAKAAAKEMNANFPASNFDLNRELSQLLVWLQDPEVVGKSLALLTRSPVHAEQIWYASVLRVARNWTLDQRKQYFSWFDQTHGWIGGNSLGKYISQIREEAFNNLSDAEKQQILPALVSTGTVPQESVAPIVARRFQKVWTMADFVPEPGKVDKSPDLARGREIFSSVQCLSCHHFAGGGGSVGPDLGGIGRRMSRYDLLRSIIEPSAAISDQYASRVIRTKDGDSIVGKIIAQDNVGVTVLVDPADGTRQKVSMSDIDEITKSSVSPMPEGLINTLKEDEIGDLLAYLESDGKVASKMGGRVVKP